MRSGKNNDSVKTKNKTNAFSKIVGFLPKKCNHVVMTTGVTANDVCSMMKNGIVNEKTRLDNYENFSSQQWLVGVQNEQKFKEEWNRVCDEIGVGAKRRIFFKDMFKSSLLDDIRGNADVVLADGCKPYNISIAEWTCSNKTLSRLCDNGIIGFNVNLLRSKIDGDAHMINHSCSIFMEGTYDSAEHEYENRMKMHVIANDVERISGGKLTVVMMMNYWDDARSQMGYFLFRKVGGKSHGHHGNTPNELLIEINGKPCYPTGVRLHSKNQWMLFVNAIEQIGEEKIDQAGIMIGGKRWSVKHPLLSKDASLIKGRNIKRTKNGYYLNVNYNAKDKANILSMVFKELGINGEAISIQK